jgi:hypothetical protein
VNAISTSVTPAHASMTWNAAGQPRWSTRWPMPTPVMIVEPYPMMPVSPTAAALARLVPRFIAIAAISICGT